MSVFLIGVATGVTPVAPAEECLVSIVTDLRPGLPAAHGLLKLKEALDLKGLPCQTAESLANAQGKVLIVAGLATGGGPAA